MVIPFTPEKLFDSPTDHKMGVSTKLFELHWVSLIMNSVRTLTLLVEMKNFNFLENRQMMLLFPTNHSQ